MSNDAIGGLVGFLALVGIVFLVAVLGKRRRQREVAAQQEAARHREIARIEERVDYGNAAGVLCGVGTLIMVLTIVTETSAVRLAAWGAIWTGWNVICGMIGAASVRRTYIVTRETDE